MPERPVRTIIEDQHILTAPATTTVADAARMMKQSQVGAIMVVEEGGRLAGIFTERDALYRVVADGRNPKAVHLAAVMTRAPRTIGPNKPFGHALHMMYEGGFRHVPVVERGRPIGMVSARDALGPELQQFAAELQQRDAIGEVLG